MKFLLFIFCIGAIRLSAQFTDWDSTSVWTVISSDPTNEPCMYYYNYNVYLKSDTVISGKSFHKIYEHGIKMVTNIGPLYSVCQSTGTFPYDYSTGYARYDPVQKKIFTIRWSPNESMFLDYNLHVGDTIKGSFTQSIPLYVTSIDSILIAGNYHKRFYFSYSGNTSPTTMYVLEGLGSSFGFLEPFSDFEIGYQLRCYFIDQILAYQDPLPSSFSPFANTCTYNVGVHELTGISQKIKTYPSPAVDVLHVEFPDEGPYALELLDVSGREVFGTKSMEQTVSVPVTTLPAGVYFLKIKSSEGTDVKKVVKQ